MSESKEKSQILLLKNSFNKEYKFTNKEISQNLHWLRQIISVIIGLIMGVIPVTGYPGFLTFVAASCGFVAFYYTKIMEIDDDDFKWELMQEGFMSSLTIFVVSWILMYNIFHV